MRSRSAELWCSKCSFYRFLAILNRIESPEMKFQVYISPIFNKGAEFEKKQEKTVYQMVLRNWEVA